MSETIKCGRITYHLKDGDTVLDNGSCYQLTTRVAGVMPHSYHPIVSKAEMRRFINMDNVKKVIIKSDYLKMPMTEYVFNE